MTPELERDIKAKMCAELAADGLEPGEVVVFADGRITIDRRLNSAGRYPRAKPVEGLYRWKP